MNMGKSFLIILMTGLFLASFNIYAQDIEVAPVRINFNIAPGESQSRSVTVKNHGNSRETISLQMQDYLVQRQGGMERLPSGSTRNSIASWISLSPSVVELEPNESANIQVNLQAPSDEYMAKWGILSFVSTQEQLAFTADREVQTGVMISGRIDIFLFYNPATGEAGRVSISNLQEVDSPVDNERRFRVNLDNLGNRITACKIFLMASNLSTMKEEKFRTIEVTTYPQTSRTVELVLPNTLPAGRYSLAAILDYPGSESLKGTQIIINVE
jgi:P pilus assembly chaperone PapD